MSAINKASRAAPIYSRAVVGLAAAALVSLGLSIGIAGEPALGTGFVFTANEEGGSISRIDLQSGQVQTFALPIMPHNVDVSAKAGLVFVVGIGGPEQAASDQGMGSMMMAGPVNKMGAMMSMASVKGMGSMKDMGTMMNMGAMAKEEPATGESEPSGKLAILSLAALDRGPIALVDLGHHPAHVVPDLDGKRVFVTDSESNTVSVVDLATRKIVKTIPTGRYPHGLRLSPDGREVFVANVEGGSVSAIDVATLAEVARIPVGKAPVQVGFTPDGTRVYVSLRDENAVAAIDRESRKVLAKIAVERKPIQVYATPDARYVYVANQGSDENPDDRVSIVDVASNAVVKTSTVGEGAHGITISADGRFVYITNIKDDSVSVIDALAQTVVKTIPVGEGPNGIAVLSNAS